MPMAADPVGANRGELGLGWWFVTLVATAAAERLPYS